MADIDTQVTELHEAEQCVQVCTVGVDQPPGVMDDLCNFEDIRLEQAQCARNREHEHRGPRIGQLTEIFDIDIALIVGTDSHYLKTGHRGRGRVGAVCGVWNYRDRAFHIMACLMIGAGDQQP